LKQSFEQRAKRLGIQPSVATTTASSTTKEDFEQFHNCKFWIWNKQEHRAESDRTRRRCCFNHIIGLPVKNNKSYPIFPWQEEIYSALQQHKLIAILKSRNVGASELLLRYALWLCLKDNKMQGKNIPVITGIRENLSLELLNRFRNLLPDYDWGTGPSSPVAEINKCRLLGFPAKRTKDLRGPADTKLVIADEFAFFDPVDQQQILPVLEAFRAE
jgi:hypothetical protein